FVLSSQQERVWFTDRFEQGLDYSYNNAGTIDFDGKLDAQILLRCFNTVIQLHQTLRTRYISVPDQPLQVIDEQFVIDMPLIEIDSTDDIAPYAKKHGQHLFELASGQLLKLTLLKLSEVKHVLLFNIHHIILDGWSLKILFRELKTLYRAYLDGQKDPLPPLPIQYLDFAHWQKEVQATPMMDRRLAYWRAHLREGRLPVLEFPTDFPRPPLQTFNGSALPVEFPSGVIHSLQDLGGRQGCTLFQTMLGVWSVLLARHSNVDEIVIGTPYHGRDVAGVENLVGYFVDVLSVYVEVPRSACVQDFLSAVGDVISNAMTNSQVSFQRIVNELLPDYQKDPSRNPVFQSMVTFGRSQEFGVSQTDVQA
ncbi:MAG: condensation domain-containing protein, partial [Psychrosphaera sp.]|nr:condensation domain-containing protein [Psychrosphaera sp.]